MDSVLVATSVEIQAEADSQEEAQLRRFLVARRLVEAIVEADQRDSAIVRLEAALTLRFGRRQAALDSPPGRS